MRAGRAALARNEGGFTLIEILAVMIIIGILAAIAIPAFFNQRNKANDSSAKEMAHTSEVAIEALGSDNDGSYSTASPANLNLVDASIPTSAGSPPKPYVSAASGTAKTWTFTITSATGNTFTVAKSSSGAVSFTCSVPAGNDRGGCPSGGSWG